MFTLRIFDANYREVGMIERRSFSDLLSLGQRLQADFGVFWRLDVTLEGVYATCLI
jgi:hypothetical protein